MIAELDEAARVRLGARPMIEPEVSRGLAMDPSVTVRVSLALNPAAPLEADVLLARDPDERVRVLIARKLGALAPALSEQARSKLGAETLETLIALAEDAAVRVRAAIADAVKDMPEAPRALILRLARDDAAPVCEPVIRFSPLLTTDDLVALVAAAPSVATRLAVARRANIDTTVSDALVANGADDVILALLSNGSAQIREATLDALAEQSATRPDWQEPLIQRPVLSDRAVSALSRIVADHLLEVLARRGDLPADTAAGLRALVSERLAAAPVAAPPAPSVGEATEDGILEAAGQGDAAKAAALLAAAAGVPLAVVRRAATLRNAKGLVSLAWRAGFTMRAGYAVQLLLARLSPGVALKAGPGNTFPLSVQEMRWQLDFLSGNGR